MLQCLLRVTFGVCAVTRAGGRAAVGQALMRTAATRAEEAQGYPPFLSTPSRWCAGIGLLSGHHQRGGSSRSEGGEGPAER